MTLRACSARGRRGAIPFGALLALATLVLAGTAGAGQVLVPERVFASPDLNGPRARGVQLAPDGSAVTYLKVKDTDLKVTDLWIADEGGGSPRLLIDGAALTPQHGALSEAEKAAASAPACRRTASWTTPGMTRVASSWCPSRGTCGSTNAVPVRFAS